MMQFYICEHCGNIVTFVKSSGVPVMCCGQKMTELVPGTTDAAVEKHVPVIQADGSQVTVPVGSVEHPMLPEHYISMIAAVDGDTVTMKFPKPGEKPELKTFCRSEKVEAYEICNLHGFWKGEG